MMVDILSGRHALNSVIYIYILYSTVHVHVHTWLHTAAYAVLHTSRAFYCKLFEIIKLNQSNSVDYHSYLIATGFFTSDIHMHVYIPLILIILQAATEALVLWL